ISAAEIKTYSPGVNVFWQKCAWADRVVCQDWAKYYVKETKKYLASPEHLLILDSVDGQTTPEFKEYLHNNRVFVSYGPANNTDRWQPVDAGLG
uniref:hypothetical protein n=1 Tax=Salmonella sp. s31506 TaxID=3159638 RepID=UPI003981249E